MQFINFYLLLSMLPVNIFRYQPSANKDFQLANELLYVGFVRNDLFHLKSREFERLQKNLDQRNYDRTVFGECVGE